MTDTNGNPLPHFTPHPTPQSLNVNLFAQDVSQSYSILQRPYVFSPEILVGLTLRFLKSHHLDCTMAVLDTYPRKYWWSLLQHSSRKSRRLAVSGDPDTLWLPSRNGWRSGEAPHDLWVFAVTWPREPLTSNGSEQNLDMRH